MIDWKKYVDAVYVIEAIPRLNRRRFMETEMKRLGISGSGLLRIMPSASPGSLEKFVAEGGHNLSPYFDYRLAQYRVFLDAKTSGFKRIMLVEDDAQFMKDLCRMERILDRLPDDADIVRLDWLPEHWGRREKLLGHDKGILLKEIASVGKESFFQIPKGFEAAVFHTTANIVSDRAIDAMLSTFDDGRYMVLEWACDRYGKSDALGLKSYLSCTPLAIHGAFDIDKIRSRDSNFFWLTKQWGQVVEDYSYPLPDGTSDAYPAIDGQFWRSSFDGVYLIHCSKFEDRLGPAMDEMGRIGVLDSGVFHVKTTNPVYAKYAKTRVDMTDGAKSLAMAWLEICSEAVENGYSKVMVVEDDARFLKDLHRLREIVEGIGGSCLCVLDWLHHCGMDDVEKKRILHDTMASSEGEFFLPDPARHGNLWNATAVSISLEGARIVRDFLEGGLVPVDWFQNNFSEVPGLTVSVSKTPAAKQRTYKGRQEDVDKWTIAQGQDPSLYNFEDRSSRPLSELWKSKLDAVYLLHCLDYPERLDPVMSELDRVGISGSGILHVENTAPIGPYLQAILDKTGASWVTPGLVDQSMALYRIFREALSKGFGRIMVVEDDARFIVDETRLSGIVSAIPDSDVVKLDWEFDRNSGNMPGKREAVEGLSAAGGTFFEPDSKIHGVLWSAAAVIYSRKALGYMESVFSQGLERGMTLDNELGRLQNPGFRRSLGLSFSVASVPAAVQLPFENHQSPNSTDVDLRLKCGQDLRIYGLEEPADKSVVESAGSVAPPSDSIVEASVDWRSVVDGIYVAHYLPQDDRLSFFKSEMKRLGVPEDMVHYRYAYPNRFSDIVTNKLKSEHGEGWNTLPGWTDAAMNNLALLHEARHAGCKRILLLENDVAFLKDTKFLKEALESVPADADVCQCEYFGMKDPYSLIECAKGSSHGNGHWAPGLYPQRGGAFTVLSEAGINSFIEYWERDPVPTDYAYRHVSGVKYHSVVRLAVQAPFKSGAIAASSTLSEMPDSVVRLYVLPEGYDHSTGKCMRDSGPGPELQTPALTAVDLPAFPVPQDRIVDSMKSLSALVSAHRGYREPSCLLARLIHESNPGGSNAQLVRMLLEQGLRVKDKKPGLPVDEWCWNGGPEGLLASLSDPPSLPDGSVPLIL